MDTLNRTQSHTPRQVIDNSQANSTSSGNRVDIRDDIANFLTPSDESIDIATNNQTLASRNPSPTSVNATNAIQQDGAINFSLYSKLVAQLPDNPEFYPEKFIINESCDATQYLKNKGEQFIKAFSASISKDPDLELSSISIKENIEGKPEIVLKSCLREQHQYVTYDSITREVVTKSKTRLLQNTQKFNLSEVIQNSENLDEFITNMRLAATFTTLLAKINAPANGFNIGVMSPFTGLWKEDKYAHKEELVEKFFTPDMKGFLSSEITRTVQKALWEEMDKWQDVPGSLGCYSSLSDEPIKMHYV